MTTKDEKITMKSLKAEIVTIREELLNNNKKLGELKEALKNAKQEIEQLKDAKNQEKKDPVPSCGSCNFTCSSRNSFKLHNSAEHGHRVKCEFCDDMFGKNSELEAHIKTHHNTEKTFECEQCGKSFVLEWRLRKHQGIHKEGTIKRCHYFNNQKNCPYEELGCMFEHSYSGICKYGKNCYKAMCSFQHNKVGELLKCEECDVEVKTENDLDKHISEKHEGWRVTQSFCDYFCRGEHGIHICWSSEDFEEYIGFDIWETRTTMECEDLFKCLKCDRTDDDRDKMREHIEAKHLLDKYSKCNFCDHKDKTWLGLKKHYKINHMNKD